MSARWVPGNRVRLLENGEGYFPRVLQAITEARSEVLVETFILFEDDVGRALQRALIAAARRGVRIDLTVDGYGSPDLSAPFIDALVAAGVRLHVFDPCPKVMGMRLKLFRRLHRKIVVVDGLRAFVGGINYSVQHLIASGPKAKQDYAVEIQGPVVRQIHAFARSALRARSDQAEAPPERRFAWRRASVETAPAVGDAQVLFLVRDNVAHRSDIERHYRAAIRAARHSVVIANAFFVPGFRLLREIRHAARRGVAVTIIVQARPDQAVAIRAARTLYGHLVQAGATLYEYEAHAFHAKVALTDDHWATVGSTNLDPVSLALNLEANVFVRDRALHDELRQSLDRLVATRCRRVAESGARRPSFAGSFFRVALFYFMRRFHAWSTLLPEHAPKIARIDAPPRVRH